MECESLSKRDEFHASRRPGEMPAFAFALAGHMLAILSCLISPFLPLSSRGRLESRFYGELVIGVRRGGTHTMAASTSSRVPISSSSQGLKTSGSEAYYKSNLDLVLKENKQLKLRLEQLEKENRGLKKAVYDLSVRHSACIEHMGKASNRFDMDNILTPESMPMDHVDGVRLSDVGSQKVAHQGVGGTQSNRKADGRQFLHKFDFKGHTGSVYAAQFSKTTGLLASGSFDQSVRVWDISTQREVLCLQEHQLNVSDICWSNDGSVLLSGGFDQCVKEWDVVKGKLLHSYNELQGFIQSVRFNPADNDVFLVGSTAKHIYVLDRRLQSTGGIAMVLNNDAKVSALILYQNGIACLSGDSHGAMKLWDLRSKACVETVFNEDTHKPITSLDMSLAPDAHGADDGRHVAVNSYDNVLRVYDNFSVLEQPQLHMGGLKLAHAIKGPRTKNWPIRSTLFQGHNFHLAMKKRAIKHQEALSGTGDRRLWSQDSESFQEMSVQDSLLVATGSADNHAYIFDVSGPSGTAELVQRLEGHPDRVCAAIFHPQEPILATCCADFNIRIWSPRSHVHGDSG